MALDIKEAGIAYSDEADVEAYYEDVDQDEMVKYTLQCLLIPVHWGDFL